MGMKKSELEKMEVKVNEAVLTDSLGAHGKFKKIRVYASPEKDRIFQVDLENGDYREAPYTQFYEFSAKDPWIKLEDE